MILRFDYVIGKDIPQLIDSEVFQFGDFCWVDFDSTDMLDKLEPIEIAEMLYTRNNYAHWGRDDGWYGELFCRRIDFNKLTMK